MHDEPALTDAALATTDRQLAEDCRIVSVEPFVIAAPHEPDAESWQRGLTEMLVVRVRAACGVEGIGIAQSNPHVARSVIETHRQSTFGDEVMSMSAFPGLSDVVVGRSAADREALWQLMYEATYLYGKRGVVLQAISAIDMACADLVGRFLGIGASYLFGGRYRDRVPVYASAVLPPSRSDLQSLASHVTGTGFRALKVGWGAFREESPTILSLIDQLSGSLPASVKLIFDIGFERRRPFKQLLQLIEQLAEYEPLWIEEPCHPDDLETIRSLTKATRVEISAGETYATVAEFEQILAIGVDIVQPDLSVCGGFTVASDVAHRAAALSCRVIPHAWLNDLLLAATLQYCATLPCETFLEYSLASGPLMQICEPPLRIADGCVDVPAGPGLGVTLDEERLEPIIYEG